MVFLYFLSVAFADFCFNKDFSITKDTMGERKLSVIRSVDVLIFLRYTPSKRSVLLWVEKFMTSSMTWQKY